MSPIHKQTLNGLFKEVYLIPKNDPYIDKLQTESLSDLKEILCLPK